MDSRRYIINILLRLFLILISFALIFVIIASANRNQMLISLTVIAVVSITLIAELVRYMLRFNRDISRFLNSVREHDFQLSFNTEKVNKSLAGIYNSFNLIIDEFTNVKIDKEVQYRYLEQIIEIIDVGIISFNANEEIILMNSAAERALNVRKRLSLSELEDRIPEFIRCIKDPANSGQLQFKPEGEYRNFAIRIKDSVFNEIPHRLVAFQDIKNEIDQNEVNTWIKLVRTLNHEIMNSLTPISSLAGTSKTMITDSKGEPIMPGEISNEDISDFIKSLTTIENRSKGLIDFVDQYRKLTKIPEPEITPLPARQLTEDLIQLLKDQFAENKIAISANISKQIVVKADEMLLNQVIINLLKNSIEALKDTESPEIDIGAKEDDQNIYISVSDNGPGIKDDLTEQIFIPFFTTKEKGSGIGLSICRQIMAAHGGSIYIGPNNPGKTTFTLKFRK